MGAGTALVEHGADSARTSPGLMQQLSPTAQQCGTEIHELQKQNFWAQVIHTSLTLLCGVGG